MFGFFICYLSGWEEESYVYIHAYVYAQLMAAI